MKSSRDGRRQPDQCRRRRAARRDRAHRPRQRARLVMADSTFVACPTRRSTRPHRFQRRTHLSRYAIRLTTARFASSPGTRKKTAYRSTTLQRSRARHILDILSQRGRTTLFAEGASRLQHRGQCTELTQPGDTAIITSAAGKVTIQKTQPRLDVRRHRGAAADFAAHPACDATPTVTPAQ